MLPRRSSPIVTSCLILAAVVVSSSVAAADIKMTRKNPVTAPIFTWTGAYVGFNFGYTWTADRGIYLSSANLNDNSLLNFGTASALGATGNISARLDGFMLGGQAGYNWQFADKWIAGVEADVAGAGVRGGGYLPSVVPAGNYGSAVTSSILRRNLEYLGTARARLGYALSPTLMTYVTGGFAFGGADLTGMVRQTLYPSFLYSDPGKADLYKNLYGWTVGAGGEIALSRNTSAKMEYLYYDLGSAALTSPRFSSLAFNGLLLNRASVVVDASSLASHYNGHVMRVGLNYHFDTSIPPTTVSAATPLFSSPEFSKVDAPKLGNWRIKATPYMWAMGTNGSITVRDQTVGADTTLIDAITNSAAFPIAFMGRVDINNGRWSAYGDLAFVQLRFQDSLLNLRSPTADVLFALSGNGHLRQTLGIGEAGVGYEIARLKQTTSSPESFTAFDAYAGTRYGYLGANLNVTALGVVGSQLLNEQGIAVLQRNVTGKIWWLDPVIGLRMRYSSGDGDHFEMRGDIGGFGVGSNFSWQTYGGWSHDFEYRGVKFAGLVGYRALSIYVSKYINGRKNGFDEILHGPVTGVSFSF
jgi:opacity protein-like surface antigen